MDAATAFAAYLRWVRLYEATGIDDAALSAKVFAARDALSSDAQLAWAYLIARRANLRAEPCKATVTAPCWCRECRRERRSMQRVVGADTLPAHNEDALRAHCFLNREWRESQRVAA